MKTYDAYLFDFDGTVAQSHELWLELLKKQLAPYDIRLTDQQFVKQIFGRYEEGMTELGFQSKEVKRLGNELVAEASTLIKQVDLYPGIQKVLQALKVQDKKLALITATDRGIVEIVLRRHNLLELFDILVTGDEVKAQKPDPAGILMALKTFNIPPTKAIMAGDSPKDLLAGRNAGTDTLLFYPASHETQHQLKELQKCQPAYTIRSWQEMFNQLQ